MKAQNHPATAETANVAVLQRVGAAMAALQLGKPVRLLADHGASLTVVALESASDAVCEHVLVSSRRARRHGMQVDDSVGAVFLPWPKGKTPADILASPHTGALRDAGPVACAAIQLVKLAGLLPVLGVVAGSPAESIAESDIRHYAQALAENLREASRARLPLKQSENAEIVLFRAPFAQQEHLAIRIGNPEAQAAPLVRVHSSCLTGDVLGSLRCDCGDQLHAALDAMAAEGHGLLIYLNQEGRGIGLANKLLAYAMQDQGLDTVDANEALGFDADERDYTLASAILRQIGVNKIRLMTNNPKKEQALVAEGIEVAALVPLSITSNPHNSDYLKTKETRCGHRF